MKYNSFEVLKLYLLQMMHSYEMYTFLPQYCVRSLCVDNTSLQCGAHALEFKQGKMLFKYVRQSSYIAWGKDLLAWKKWHANGCFSFRS